jgi:hypothetical protein
VAQQHHSITPSSQQKAALNIPTCQHFVFHSNSEVDFYEIVKIVLQNENT